MTQQRGKGSQAQVVIVEDAESVRDVLHALVEAEGFTVVAYGTAAEALAHVGRERVALLIVDLGLPDLDGMQLLERVRAINTTTRIIIYTAYGSFASAKEAVNLGASAYIEKGSDLAELRQALHRAYAEYLRVYSAELEAQVAVQTTALRQSETRYRTLFANAVEGVYRSTPAGHFEEVNPALVQMLGYDSAEELLAINIPSDLYVSPSQVERLTAAYKNTDIANGVEMIWKKKNGDPIIVNVYARRLYDDGNIVAYEGSVIDVTEKVQTERARQESERFVRSTLDALSEHICVLDETGTILMVNRAWQEYPAKNSSGQGQVAEGINYLSVCDSTTGEFAQQAAIFAAGIRAVLGGERESFSYDYYCPLLPHPGWFSVHVTKFPGEGPTRVVVAHEDITEQKKAEAALRESEARFRATFEQSAVGIAHIDLEGRFFLVNQKLCDILGYARDELQQRFCSEVTHPDDRTETDRAAQRTIAGEISDFVLEKRCFRRDGTIVWVKQTGTLLRTADGTPLYFIDVVEDISIRKQIEAEQARLIAILENTPDFVVTTTVDGRAVYMNRAARDLFGLTDEVSVREWRGPQAYTEQSREIVVRQGIPAALRLGTWTGEAVAVRLSGEEVPISQVIIAHRDEKGQAQYLSMLARDISEQKKAEEALQALSRRVLDAQEQERRHLARELHDELGQVLSALKMTLQNGQRRPTNLAIRVEESVAMVQTALEQVRTLSRNLRPPMLDDLGLVAALRWYANQQAQLTEVEIQLHADMPKHRFPLEVETVCFRVVQEALTNIMRHARAQHVWIDLRYHDGKISLLVQDDGVGFDVEAAFAQTAHGKSSGLLGMRERTQLIGGQMQVTSSKGVGTEVRAVFPAEPDHTLPVQEY